MSDGLTGPQLANLVRLFDAELGRLGLPGPSDGEVEPGYTSRIIRPLIETWASTLRRSEILVRGDGGLNPPRALVVGSLTFYPDVEVVATGKRYLAVEVKFLRGGQDPTGAFAKALGQAALYRELGFASSHAIVIDLRPLPSVSVPAIPAWSELERAGIHVHWFARVDGPEGTILRRSRTADATEQPSVANNRNED